MSEDQNNSDAPAPEAKAPERSRLLYLDAMGIDLWTPRRVAAPAIAEAVAETEADVPQAAQDAESAVDADHSEEVVSAPAPPESAAEASIADVSVDDERPAPHAQPEADASEPSQTPEVTPTEPAPAASPDIDVPVEVPAVAAAASESQADDPRADAPLPELQTMVAACTRCALSGSRTNTVFGSGNPDADWLFVGEAPGREEDRQGEAFVGRAGKLLDSMLFALSLDRERVYMTNVLKCRPTGNCDPGGEEVRQCEGFLNRQIALVKPKVIVAMGRFAAQSLLQSEAAIETLRGSEHAYRDTGIALIVTYHPAYLLRSPDQKGKVWDDLVMARKVFAQTDQADAGK